MPGMRARLRTIRVANLIVRVHGFDLAVEATSRPMRGLRARYTSPMPPAPNRREEFVWSEFVAGRSRHILIQLSLADRKTHSPVFTAHSDRTFSIFGLARNRAQAMVACDFLVVVPAPLSFADPTRASTPGFHKAIECAAEFCWADCIVSAGWRRSPYEHAFVIAHHRTAISANVRRPAVGEQTH